MKMLLTANDVIETHSELLKNVACGVSFGNGWAHIINSFCLQVENHCTRKNIDLAVIGQIKEKFGTLRIYVDRGDETVHRLAMFAEAMSHSICEDCGNRGEYRGDLGWVRTLCDDCHTATLNKIKQSFKDYNANK